ncbi:LuxR family transcriptional regulator [Streptomyces sp. SAJ15]|uniref:helix-turn-helix transcriptional regulator n=1 Tax=Streptomyces sp. SAJ15 TaxID=2011095 RepID=UPI001186B158|nr:LuxR family transcriptional regulator [Streptomyces sp. SAJ15]TVL88952.1 LuxR family transcriptional regulator [Streptomyces sp. SAJ15]
MSNAAPSGANAERGRLHRAMDRRTAGAVDDRQIEDDIAQELMAVRELIETTVVKHRVRQSRSHWVSAVDTHDEEMVAAGDQLIGTARRSIDVVYAVADPSHSRVVRTVLTRWLTTGPRNVRTRMLCNRSTVDRPLIRAYAEAGRPLEVRVARVPMLSALMVDGRESLVCADVPGGSEASSIRDSGVIETIAVLFEGLWRSAVVVTDEIDFGDRARTKMVRQILEWLRLGVTDEVAARELAVSVRTYRRCVAEIMTLLEANSRFQAGVRAAELGLLPPSNAAEPPSRRG